MTFVGPPIAFDAGLDGTAFGLVNDIDGFRSSAPKCCPGWDD
jgi:hypothetical protein